MSDRFPTLEKKWDVLWPLACSVSHAIERVDRSAEALARDEKTLLLAARELKKAVDAISPDPVSSTNPNQE